MSKNVAYIHLKHVLYFSSRSNKGTSLAWMGEYNPCCIKHFSSNNLWTQCALLLKRAHTGANDSSAINVFPIKIKTRNS